MTGLALGSYIGGKFIDRGGRPLFLYAILEGSIGVYCLLIPYLIDGALPAFQWIYGNFQNSYTTASLLRFLICFLILIIPSFFMGATLPILGKFVSNDPEVIGRDVGTLYSLNTLGAVVGAFASAFLLMKNFGISTTIFISASLNISIAIIILVFLNKNSLKTLSTLEKVIDSTELTKKFTPEMLLILFGFGVSGVAALIYQVTWNRIFSLLLGSSVYAFSLILTGFILGLASGTMVFSRICHRFEDLKKVFGLLQVGIGLSALIALPFFGNIPMVNRWVYLNWGLDFFSIQGANFLIIITLIFVPTFLMGAQFPVVVKLIAKKLETLGHHVGTAYASNTIGTILGSFLGGFLLIPWLGIQGTILFAIFMNVVLGVGLLFGSPTLSPNTKAYVLPGLIFLVLFSTKVIKPWDKAVISSGSFMPYRIDDLKEAIQQNNKILYYKEGTHTTVTTELAVTGNIFLRVNGKTDASLAMDMRTQLLSGYLPMFFAKNPQTVLVVGQGSGVTLGAVEQFPVKEIDLVEISPAVIEGSRFFEPFNHNALKDPRVRLILEDGRNHITLTEKKYDVIISEPSNPWISGVGALFTQDFYKLVRPRLNPGGIVCIWMHTNMSPESFKSISKAFHSEFPFVTMWESIVGDDYLLIGSDSPYTIPYERVRRLIESSEQGKDLRRLGIRSVRDLMGLMIMDQANLKKFIKSAPIHTDDNSLLEFGAPEYIYKDERHIIVQQLTPFFQTFPEILKFEELSIENQKQVRNDIASLDRSEIQVREIKRKARIDQYLDQAVEAVNRGALEKAVQLYKKILEQEPDHILTHLNLGNIYSEIQEYQQAEQEYLTTLKLNPYYVFGSLALARLYLNTQKSEKAVQILEKISSLLPRDKEVAKFLNIVRKKKA